MAKKESNNELQRIDKKIIEDIKRKQEEIKNTLKIDISFPKASRSWYEELQAKIKRQKGDIKF